MSQTDPIIVNPKLEARPKRQSKPVARMKAERGLFSFPKYWAECYGPAPFLPMSRAEMDQLGWDSCDIIIVTGDAYVDHPSFGMAVIGRTLEAQGFRVGIISQPDWHSKDDFMQLGEPNLFFGVTAGNMDSMINRYTAERKLRHDDAYTPHNEGGKRPDRAVTVYTQRCKEAYKKPVVIGGIEASLRRIAHYDYWSDKVRRSVLFDSKADMLMFGNAERPLLEMAHRFANGETIDQMQDIRGTAVIRKEPLPGWQGVDSTHVDVIGKIEPIVSPYEYIEDKCAIASAEDKQAAIDEQQAQPIVIQPHTTKKERRKPWDKTYVLLPAYDKVRAEKTHYAHSSRILHKETNPGCARALAQRHGDRIIWINPPAYPLETEEMDAVFDLPYARVPHPSYGKAKIPAYDMIKTSVNIMRGCFGGCTFCSITEHEGRVIQSRSEESIIREIEQIRDKVPGFTGVISDLGGPTANMYKLRCKSPQAEQACRRLSCVWPQICGHLDTDQTPTVELYRKARKVEGVKKVLIASGVRYDLAIEDPNYVRELVTHHVGGYLKIAPEHTEQSPLDKMMKPGMGTYDRFKTLFDKFTKEAGKEQFLIPYFISAHPGTKDEDMLNLALWLKERNFKLDQVQNFYPSPMANATTMYHTNKNPIHKVTHNSEVVEVPKGEIHRRLHRAFLRYHDPANWPLLRKTLIEMNKPYLIGNGPKCLVPFESRNELKGREHKAYAKRSANKAFAKGKTASAATAQKGLTRFSDNQPHNQLANGESAHDENANKSKANPRRRNKNKSNKAH
jgi:uncharacterized radical SAM protein YgiQ